MMERYPEKILLGNYDRNLITKWMNDLRYFTFAKGGLNEFVNDGDEFVVSFAYSDREELLKKLSSIGVTVRQLKPGERIFRKDQPVDKKKNHIDLPEPIEQFNDLVQPKYQLIGGAECFIFVGDGYFWISVSNTIGSGEWWKVFPEDVEVCMKLEELFDKAALMPSRVYHTEDFGRFVNRNNYPQFFRSPVEPGILNKHAGNGN